MSKTRGHPLNSDFFIESIQLVTHHDYIIGNPVPHSTATLDYVNFVRNSQQNNITFPLTSHESAQNDESSINQNGFQYHEVFHPSTRTISSLTDNKIVFKRGQSMKEESVVAIKKLPDGWTYWVRSERKVLVHSH